MKEMLMSTEELLARGVEEVIEKKKLENKIKSGKKLRVKLGVDPTSADLHLGHFVAFRKLKEFQNLGHQVIFVIGDFTASIGDPTGRLSQRPILTEKEISENFQTYLRQAGKILDPKRLETRHNSEWYKKGGAYLILEICKTATVSRILERDDFQKRLAEGKDLTLQEFIYPVLQGYDSVVLKADVEIGGTDQKFNMLTGRDIQRRYGLEPQDVITIPLLIGLDGARKMSKSYGNYIGIEEDEHAQFGKIMSISDKLILHYFDLVLEYGKNQLNEIKKALDKGENPRDWKLILAFKIVEIFHGEKKAKKAREQFEAVFSKKQKPKEIPVREIKIKDWLLIELLAEMDFAKSKSEARRLIRGGAVEVDEVRITDPGIKVSIPKGGVLHLRVGPHRFLDVK